jgi:hypothetical protein
LAVDAILELREEPLLELEIIGERLHFFDFRRRELFA